MVAQEAAAANYDNTAEGFLCWSSHCVVKLELRGRRSNSVWDASRLSLLRELRQNLGTRASE